MHPTKIPIMSWEFLRELKGLYNAGCKVRGDKIL